MNSNKRLSKRKCEMWISNNKVLVGNSKKPHARNPNFETEETRLLISLWGDPKIQKTLITTHKKHPVIVQLADQMREHGYFRSADEINTRIKNLKCFYNRIKKDVEMGIITEPTWKHYGAMDEIVTRPVFGNRVQQPHLQHLQQPQSSATTGAENENNGASTSGLNNPSAAGIGVGSDLDSTDGLRPEDLLSVKGDEDADFEDTGLVPKDEPVDMDELAMDQNADMDDVNDIFPKLSQYLQLAAAAATSKGASKSLLKYASKSLRHHHHHQPIIQIPSPPPTLQHHPFIEIKQSPPGSPEPTPVLNSSAVTTTTASTSNKAPSPTAQLLSALSLTPTIVPISTATVANSSSNASTHATTNVVSSAICPMVPSMVTVPMAAVLGSAAQLSTSTTITNSTTPATQALSKISLVPTNILMKPKATPAIAPTPTPMQCPTTTPTPSLIHTATTPTPATGATAAPTATATMTLNPHQPQSISFGGENYVCANTVSNGKSVYTSQQKDGQPMKVLLVNTFQKPVSQVTVPAGNMIIANSSAASAMNAAAAAAAAAGIVVPGTGPTVISTSAQANGASNCAASASAISVVAAAANTVSSITTPISATSSSATAAAATVASAAAAAAATAGQMSPAPATAAANSGAASSSKSSTILLRKPVTSVYTTRAARAMKLSGSGAGSAGRGPAAIASVVAEMENSGALAAMARASAAKVSAAARRSAAAAAAAAAVSGAKGAAGAAETTPATSSGGPVRSGRRGASVQPAATTYKTTQAGFRSLLQHLIGLQTDTLATSRKRLELEQQRLSFEQSMGDRLLAVLEKLATKRE